MQVADEQSYQEVINALRSYTNSVSEASGKMYRAGSDCVDNTQNDPAAVTSNERLQGALSKINGAVQDIGGIIADLQEELEEIREAAAAAASGD